MIAPYWLQKAACSCVRESDNEKPPLRRSLLLLSTPVAKRRVSMLC